MMVAHKDPYSRWDDVEMFSYVNFKQPCTIHIRLPFTSELSTERSRDPTRDGCIKEFIKRKWSSGLFWAVGAAEKKTSQLH